MKATLKVIGGFVGAIVVLTVAVAGFYAGRTGAFGSFPPATDTCEAFALDGGSAEDIVVDRVRNLAYISALDRRAPQPVTGTVSVIDLTAVPWTVSDGVVGAPANFRPHGLSLYTAADGEQTLMAISHPVGEGHRVEIFDRHDDGVFHHAKSVSGEALFKPNDLAAVGPRQFFLVNDTGARTAWQRAGEQVIGTGYSTLVHFDGEQLSEVLDDLASPGGINVSGDGGWLYIAETQAKRVRIMSRHRDTGAVVEEARVPLAGLPDNIDVAADGAAWITSHGSAIGLVHHFIDPANASPSIVNRLSRSSDGTWSAPEVRVSNGRELAAASVAVRLDDQLLMGSITERKIIVCPAPSL